MSFHTLVCVPWQHLPCPPHPLVTSDNHGRARDALPRAGDGSTVKSLTLYCDILSVLFLKSRKKYRNKRALLWTTCRREALPSDCRTPDAVILLIMSVPPGVSEHRCSGKTFPASSSALKTHFVRGRYLIKERFHRSTIMSSVLREAGRCVLERVPRVAELLFNRKALPLVTTFSPHTSSDFIHLYFSLFFFLL